jgi:hypothetical protein
VSLSYLDACFAVVGFHQFDGVTAGGPETLCDCSRQRHIVERLIEYSHQSRVDHTAQRRSISSSEFALFVSFACVSVLMIRFTMKFH